MIKITSTIIAAALFISGASAQNCQPGHLYYRDVTIDNTANATSLTDYQVKITMNTGLMVAQGKLNADGSDLRILDVNCTPLYFYMDSAVSSSQNAIWVEVPSIPANSTVTIQVYYGNVNETTAVSNGDSTFMFFDDFEDGSVDMNKWTVTGTSTVSESGGMLTFASGNTWPTSAWQFIRSNATFNTPVVVETGIMQSTSSGLSFINGTGLERYIFRTNMNDDSLRTAYSTDTSSGTIYADQFYPEIISGVAGFADLRARAWIDASNYLEFTEFTNVNTGQTNTAAKTFMQFPMNGFNIGFTSFQSNSPISSSYIRVRSSEVGDLTATVSSELSVPVGIAEPGANMRIKVIPNPSNGSFLLDLSGIEGKARVTITDIAGRTVIEKEVTGGNIAPVDMTADAGVYLLIVESNDNSFRQRVVIK